MDRRHVRKWDDHDMKKLKQLIALTVSWIDTYQLTKKFAQDMTE